MYLLGGIHTPDVSFIEFPILLCKLLLINAIRIGKLLLKWPMYISWMLSRQNSQHSFVEKIPKASEFDSLFSCQRTSGGFFSEVPVRQDWCDLGAVAAAATTASFSFHFTWWLLSEEKVDTLDWRECCRKVRASQAGKEEVLEWSWKFQIWWWGHESGKGRSGGCL